MQEVQERKAFGFLIFSVCVCLCVKEIKNLLILWQSSDLVLATSYLIKTPYCNSLTQQ